MNRKLSKSLKISGLCFGITILTLVFIISLLITTNYFRESGTEIDIYDNGEVFVYYKLQLFPIKEVELRHYSGISADNSSGWKTNETRLEIETQKIPLWSYIEQVYIVDENNDGLLDIVYKNHDVYIKIVEDGEEIEIYIDEKDTNIDDYTRIRILNLNYYQKLYEHYLKKAGLEFK